ncbi:MAG: PQQ-dependent sugar dehydrogenase [Gammaproteobacteria bacterium]|nr:PQQ-dependent sugar dehydrogenase [Gammaproteobacteria bacterium]
MTLQTKFLLIYLLTFQVSALSTEIINTEKHNIRIELLVSGLQHPWGMAFLPNGNILVTERAGRLRLIKNNKLLDAAVSGLPRIKQHGQGGLLGIALHPQFEKNNWVYLAYAGKGKGGYGTEVIRGRLTGMQLTNVETLFRALPKSRGGNHFGSRLLFAPDGSLFISLGDRGDRDRAQDLNDHAGTLIRINDDGTVPNDNPFVDTMGMKPEIYCYGNRNMQGMALQAGSNLIWTHEHGPQGGDEVNIMRAGVNYGWPVITYGVNYVIGTKIGEGTHKDGMAQPIHKWVPSIAPSGMTFYSGDVFPEWQGDLFVGSLKFGLLVRLEVSGDKIIHEERMLHGNYGRIRDVVQGPDGLLYLLTDEQNGSLYRIGPD